MTARTSRPSGNGDLWRQEMTTNSEREALAELSTMHEPHPQWRYSLQGAKVCEGCSHGDVMVEWPCVNREVIDAALTQRPATEPLMKAPAIREALTTLDAMADRMDRHSYDEIRSAIESIPDCEAATATDHVEHATPEPRVVRTAEEVRNLPNPTAFVDSVGDIGVWQAGAVRYPETATMDAERAIKKYGPLTILTAGPAQTVTADDDTLEELFGAWAHYQSEMERSRGTVMEAARVLIAGHKLANAVRDHLRAAGLQIEDGA